MDKPDECNFECTLRGWGAAKLQRKRGGPPAPKKSFTFLRERNSVSTMDTDWEDQEELLLRSPGKEVPEGSSRLVESPEVAPPGLTTLRAVPTDSGWPEKRKEIGINRVVWRRGGVKAAEGAWSCEGRDESGGNTWKALGYGVERVWIRPSARWAG